jgi:hypothetical protein
MNIRLDGSAVAVYIAAADRLRVEFNRYASSDSLCCPSGRSVALFAIERAGGGPVVQLSSVLTQGLTPRR